MNPVQIKKKLYNFPTFPIRVVYTLNKYYPDLVTEDSRLRQAIKFFECKQGKLADFLIYDLRDYLSDYLPYIKSVDKILIPPLMYKNYKVSQDPENKHKLKVVFPYNEDVKNMVASLDGARWTGKYWSVLRIVPNILVLISAGFNLSKDLRDWVDRVLKKYTPTDNIRIEGLKKELYPFQKAGVDFACNKRRVLIADEMGLGKTVQAIGFLQHEKENAFPAIIICPSSLKYNWAREIKEWMSDDVGIYVINGMYKQQSELTEFQVRKGKYPAIIVNYEVLANRGKKLKGWLNFFKRAKYRTVILDEVQYIKNRNAKSNATIKIAKKAKNILALSGTPIENRPIEFFNCLHLLRPEIFWSYTKYGIRYCAGRRVFNAWDFTGSSNLKELNDLIERNIMIRRLKKDVYDQLPDKIYSVIPLELDNRDKYDELEYLLDEWIAENMDILPDPDLITPEESCQLRKVVKSAGGLIKLTKLRRVIAEGKIQPGIQWIKDFLNQSDKLVVFMQHLETRRILYEEFRDIAVYIDGSVNARDRAIAVDRFQNDPNIRLFLGTMAAAEGITLTAASSVAFLELVWNPMKLEQAEDRVHRIGQTASYVNVYYLIAYDTIEETMIKLLNKKKRNLSCILDGQQVNTDMYVEFLAVKKKSKLKARLL